MNGRRAALLAAAVCATVHAQSSHYDSVAAMDAAGRQVPAQVESYSFFLFDAIERIERDTRELSERLAPAAAEKDYVGLTGPDPERNRVALKAALVANTGRDLTGLTLIYLGPSGDAPAIRALIDGSGASLRYVVFPPES